MRKLLLTLLVLGTLSTYMLAQDKEPVVYYHVLEYMDVAPGMGQDYLALEGVWKKIHKANIDAGKYEGWELSAIIFPYDANRGYNYVVRTVFSSADQLGEHMQNWSYPDLKAILTAEEIAMVEKTATYRRMVKSEVWTVADMVMGENAEDAEIAVFNYFSSPAGKNVGDHLTIEQEIWKPVHQSRIASGEMAAWGMAVLELPWGSDYPYDSATVDAFTSAAGFLKAGDNLMDHFAKAHPDQDVDKLMTRTGENSDLIRSEVRQVIDDVWNE